MLRQPHALLMAAMASPELPALKTLSIPAKPRDLRQGIRYRRIRKMEVVVPRSPRKTRAVGLTLPRFLGRLPFNPKDAS